MVLWASLLFIHGVAIVGSVPWGATPENITVMFLSPSEVRVSWRTAADSVEKYDVTYKPTDASYRVVVVVAGNSESVTLTGLQANTQYQVVITAVTAGKKFRSRPVVFRTLEKVGSHETVQITGGPPPPVPKGRTIPPHPNSNPHYVPGIYQVRGIEVGIVCLVLLVWVGAIVLFFNRWGKIRMLLPYQPDYKDTQLKVPGSGACQPTVTCQNNSTSPFCCSQRWVQQGYRCLGEELGSRLGRSRINSAIYLGHQRSEEAEPLCRSPLASSIRKTKSADHLPRLHPPLLAVSPADKPVEQYL